MKPLHPTTRRRLVVGALVAGLSVPLVGCAGDEAVGGGTTQLSATEHNRADVAFASDMIQHHAQALSLVDLTLGRRLDPELQQLVEQLRTVQGAQVETMTDWLFAWGEPIPETVRDHANAGHGSGADPAGSAAATDAPGMVSAEEMAALADAPAPQFRDAWLRAMVEHHRGAVELARQHRGEGRYRAAVELGEEIVASHADQVAAMRRLLDG